MLLLENETVQGQFKGYYYDAALQLLKKDSLPGSEQSTARASSQNTADTNIVH